jgi:hypothetical protein
MHKPAIVLTADSFATDARSNASIKGWPGLRIVPDNVPPECTIASLREAGVSSVMGDIIDALTKPLIIEAKIPKPQEIEKPSRFVFRGDLLEVNQFFYKRGWTDGLPILPPTEEAVAEMLTGTDLPPDNVVAKIIPRLGKATVEKIAINAVMAGALPTYMPVLIAAVQAVMDPDALFGTTEVSTASWVPFWIINGSIRHDLHVNSGQGALSPGDIANATIGRAMGLIIKNIGGARKGIEDMGIFGNPGKYTMVIAENEEATPWEPMHVQQGFKKEDSTVTISFPNRFLWTLVLGTDAKGIIRGVLASMANFAGGLTLIVQPEHARTLAQDGWTKNEIADYIYQYARVPAYRSSSYWRNWVPGRTRPPLNPDDTVPVLRGSDAIRVLVAGGVGGLGVAMAIGGWTWVTKKVELPKNWDKLVKKYRDLVPTYVRY